MGPHIPLNFFMTRLLFVEKNKVNSLKAKSDKSEILIVVDNPKILLETAAKSLPPVPFPPAAPPSPAPVEGWKGVKVGGWIGSLGGSKSKLLNAPAVYQPEDSSTTDTTAAPSSEFSHLKVGGDDDDTEITAETDVSHTFEVVKPKSHTPPPQTQLFPANSSRCLGSAKKSSSIGRKLGVTRPSMVKKKSSSKSASSMLKLSKGDSSPGGSIED